MSLWTPHGVCSRDFCLDPTRVLRIDPIHNVVSILSLLSTIELNKNRKRDKDHTLSVYIKSMSNPYKRANRELLVPRTKDKITRFQIILIIFIKLVSCCPWVTDITDNAEVLTTYKIS